MNDPLVKKKALEAKRLRDKYTSIPESKYKQRAVIQSKIRILMDEIHALQRFNSQDAARKSIISELKEWYKKRTFINLGMPDFNKYKDEELLHHLNKIKARGGVDRIK